MDLELLAKVVRGVEVVTYDRRLGRMKRQVGDGRIGNDGKRIGDDIDRGRDAEQREHRTRRVFACTSCDASDEGRRSFAQVREKGGHREERLSSMVSPPG